MWLLYNQILEEIHVLLSHRKKRSMTKKIFQMYIDTDIFICKPFHTAYVLKLKKNTLK